MINADNKSSDNGRFWFPKKDSEDDHKTSPRILKRVINSAIYVEKPAASTSNTNLRLPQKLSSTDLLEIKTKRCTCSVDNQTCRCHANQLVASMEAEEHIKKPNNVVRVKKPQSSTKVSQVVKSVETIKSDQQARKTASKKISEKKENDDAKLKEELIKQQQENFKKWLLQKKQIEMRNKRKKEKEIEELELKQLEREKKQLENELNFQLWLKKKEEVLLEQKIKKELEGIYDLERKQQQIRDNEKAFKEWLQNSKNKQKPVPFNKGVQSLRSATSITYVNPNPWNTIT